MPDNRSVRGWHVTQGDLGRFHGKSGMVKQGTNHLECFLSSSLPEVVAPTLTLTWSPRHAPSMVALVLTSTCCCYCSRFHPQRRWVVTCKAVELSLCGTDSVCEGGHVVACHCSRWFEESTFESHVLLLSLQLLFAFAEKLPPFELECHYL
jgi:hypothetical protein